MSYQRANRGRPTKCTEDLIKSFREYILKGLPRNKTCDMLGITLPTFYDWLKRGERYQADPENNIDDEIYDNFSYMVKVSEAQWQLNEIEQMKKKDYTHWQREMTILERRDRANWGKTEGREISGPGGGPITTASTELTDEQLAAILNSK